MCGTCGCTETAELTIEQKILSRNDHIAVHNREWFSSHGVLAVNLMSSPGSGKTTLLERTVRELGRPAAVIEGDQETTFDADRIQATGCPVVQINTGTGCHLDAGMIAGVLPELSVPAGSVLFIENVGNLVCPAVFDLGESCRVVIMSATEGPDKPLKYPHMFRTADLIVLNKVDLLPYLDFPLDLFTSQIGMVNPQAAIVQVSATQGTGMASWYSWLQPAAVLAHSQAGHHTHHH